MPKDHTQPTGKEFEGIEGIQERITLLEGKVQELSSFRSFVAPITEVFSKVVF